MNAYGPSFFEIVPNKLAIRKATIPGGDWHKRFTVNIDLKLNENTSDKKANIFGVTDVSTYPIIGTLPAVFLQPNSKLLEVCFYLNGANQCKKLDNEVLVNEWFNLKIQQKCDPIFPAGLDCKFSVKVRDVVEWVEQNTKPSEFINVNGIIGNTYSQDDIIAASGYYSHFELDTSEDGTNLVFFDAENI